MIKGQFNVIRCPMRHCFLLGALLAAAAPVIEAVAEPTAELQISMIEEPKSEHFGRICVIGVDRSVLARLRQSNLDLKEWHRLFSVKLQPPSSQLESDELPNVAGRYEILDSGFRFTPRFAPTRGLIYLVRVKIEDRSPANGTFILSDPSSPVPVTTGLNTVYPSADSIPENTLRLYVHFSRPMRRGQVIKRIRLLDENDDVIHRAFIVGPLGELWDRDQRRLTLLLDPGRIKRGVGPNQRLGPALVEGSERTLVIDGQFIDAEGRFINTELRKTYKIVAAVRDAVHPSRWTIAAPETNSRAPLRIGFTRALDHGMLSHAIRVHEVDGGEVNGHASISAGELEWSFTPTKPWKNRIHAIRVANNLEDISGNNIVGPLDVKTNSPRPPFYRESKTRQTELQFTPIEQSRGREEPDADGATAQRLH